jgi:hypothetical protein
VAPWILIFLRSLVVVDHYHQRHRPYAGAERSCRRTVKTDLAVAAATLSCLRSLNRADRCFTFDRTAKFLRDLSSSSTLQPVDRSSCALALPTSGSRKFRRSSGVVLPLPADEARAAAAAAHSCCLYRGRPVCSCRNSGVVLAEQRAWAGWWCPADVGSNRGHATPES